MYLVFSTMSRLLLGFIIFAVLAHSARATNESFIYPGVSKPSVANVSDVSVYRNDSMIVEYNQFGYTTHLSMSMNCFDSQTSALAVNSQTSTASGNVYQFGPCESQLTLSSKSISTYTLTKSNSRRKHRPRQMVLLQRLPPQPNLLPLPPVQPIPRKLHLGALGQIFRPARHGGPRPNTFCLFACLPALYQRYE